MLEHAQGNISEARSKAEKNLNESRVVYDKSIETQNKAYEARNISAQFKVGYIFNEDGIEEDRYLV